MKSAKLKREDVRKTSLVIPVNEEEKQEIQATADNMGISMSAFARMIIKDFMKKGNE